MSDYKWYKYIEIPSKRRKRIFPIAVIDSYGWPILVLSIEYDS